MSSPTRRIKAFYRRKRTERETRHQAVLALTRRRVDVVHGMLRNRTRYDPTPRQAA